MTDEEVRTELKRISKEIGADIVNEFDKVQWIQIAVDNMIAEYFIINGTGDHNTIPKGLIKCSE